MNKLPEPVTREPRGSSSTGGKVQVVPALSPAQSQTSQNTSRWFLPGPDKKHVPAHRDYIAVQVLASEINLKSFSLCRKKKTKNKKTVSRCLDKKPKLLSSQKS